MLVFCGLSLLATQCKEPDALHQNDVVAYEPIKCN